jgi:hypothetical protein
MDRNITRGGNDTAADTRRHLDLNAGRRAFMRSIGIGMAATAVAAGAASVSGEAQAQLNYEPGGDPGDLNPTTDAQVLNFALNLEYLEAEFYLRAAFGRGLAPEDTTGTGTRGGVIGGRRVDFNTPAIRQYAEEIAIDEENHVQFLRAALGAAKVARPKIDIGAAFAAAAQAAGLGSGFDAYANENNFLLAAFIFEDVGVTAYKGAARLIDNKDFLEAAAGILAVEAYHAGIIRTTLFAKGIIEPTVNISNLRDSVDGTTDLDQPIIGRGAIIPRELRGQANLVPTDATDRFSRPPARYSPSSISAAPTRRVLPNGSTGRSARSYTRRRNCA